METVVNRQRGRIKARIIDYENGLKTVDGIKAIRIHSADYTLLIMEDYTPVLGKIKGNVTLLCENEELEYKNIVGFYKHQKNAFTLILDDRMSEENSAEETK